jgi:acetolactate synthase-1/2/3 large subunit
MKITVSQLIVRYMERLGVEFIFGMPGAHILPVYDSLYHSSIQSILAKHEQGAAFMAGGYARASGKIGACITTAGPGATNLVTGIANAFADRQPILVVTGEAPTHIFGKGGLQESSGEGGAIDQAALFRGITRYHKIVERTDYLPQVLNKASRILLSGNAGPVLLSFPFNVQKELVDEQVLEQIKTRRHARSPHKDTHARRALGKLILAAKSPVIVAGYGCIKASAHDLVAKLSESLKIPVTTSLKGKGVIDERSPLSLGPLGVTSFGHAYRYIVDTADLLIVLGAGFNERTSYLWDQKLLQGKQIAQVDNDHEQLEKVFRADLAIHGDIKDVLTEVLADIDARPLQGCKVLDPSDLTDVSDSGNAASFRATFPLVERFFAKLERDFPGDLLIFDDNIIFAQNFFRSSARKRYFPNSGISSLGHAIPAAIGARFARSTPTFAVLGDGGFQMCCMEIMTAVNYQKPLNVVMFNNATMGLIRKNQFQQYEKRFINCDFINPDYALLARSFGINHFKVEAEADIDRLFKTADLVNESHLIEILLDKDTFPSYSSRR